MGLATSRESAREPSAWFRPVAIPPSACCSFDTSYYPAFTLTAFKLEFTGVPVQLA